MSALNLHVGPESVTLLADAGFYDESGTVLHFGPKVWFSDSLKLAMSATGLSCVWERLESIADGATSQYDILAALPDVLRGLDSDERFSASKRNTRIGVAFWAEGHGPQACYIVGSCGRTRSEEPYKLIGVQGLLQPFIDGVFVPGVALTKESARELIEAQRRVKDEGYYCVGGAAELITVDAKGVRQEIVASWPQDRVGERIDPFMSGCKRLWRRLGKPIELAA